MNDNRYSNWVNSETPRHIREFKENKEKYRTVYHDRNNNPVKTVFENNEKEIELKSNEISKCM
jgi:hypothetical protein